LTAHQFKAFISLGPNMIKVFNKNTNELLGRISEAELQFLTDQLEEESLEDKDYYIRKETLDTFEQQGGTAHLLGVLRGGLRHDDAIEIRWQRE
jgi:hypothetical protein